MAVAGGEPKLVGHSISCWQQSLRQVGNGHRELAKGFRVIWVGHKLPTTGGFPEILADPSPSILQSRTLSHGHIQLQEWLGSEVFIPVSDVLENN